MAMAKSINQTESEVAKFCGFYGIYNWSLNSDGLVDVNGDVDLRSLFLNRIPLKFGTVTGYFKCSFNKLTSLEGSPHTVGNHFICDSNKLTSLEGAPRKVGNAFSCEFNKIRSFEGLVNINSYFYCGANPISKIWSIINYKSDKWDNEKMDFFNDLDIIRGEEIVLDRLNFFLSEIGLNPVETVKGYKIID